MITLNLIPKKEKINLEWDARRRLVLVFTGAAFIGLAFFSSILAGANLYIMRNIEKSSALLSFRGQLPLGREIKAIEEGLAKTDKKLKQISEIRNRIFPKSFILAEIALMLPEGCSLIALNIKSGGSVDLAGLAKERTALLSFKKKLEDNQKISDLNFPLANLLKEKNIEFTLSFKMAASN